MFKFTIAQLDDYFEWLISRGIKIVTHHQAIKLYNDFLDENACISGKDAAILRPFYHIALKQTAMSNYEQGFAQFMSRNAEVTKGINSIAGEYYFGTSMTSEEDIIDLFLEITYPEAWADRPMEKVYGTKYLLLRDGKFIQAYDIYPKRSL